MTDGQYNDLDNTQIDRIPGMSNADNELGPVIPASGRNRAFRYDPNDPNNRLYRSATGRTLADVAMYYWNRDLMPNLANNVPVDADNPSFWQNVTMYFGGGIETDNRIQHRNASLLIIRIFF